MGTVVVMEFFPFFPRVSHCASSSTEKDKSICYFSYFLKLKKLKQFGPEVGLVIRWIPYFDLSPNIDLIKNIKWPAITQSSHKIQTDRSKRESKFDLQSPSFKLLLLNLLLLLLFQIGEK